MANTLDKLFHPKSIAVVGASDVENSVGYSVFKNLLWHLFPVYPINIKGNVIMGKQSYKSVIDVPDEIDLAVVATPAFTVPGIIEQCGAKGIGAVIIISSGFKEVGKEGEELERQVLEIAKKYGIRIVGPNCLGFLAPNQEINASFFRRNVLPGSIAFVSQSGALGTAVLDWSVRQNVWFSYFISIWSMLDITYHDLIEYLNNDPNTKSILIYMESLRDAEKFLDAAKAFTQTKPIFILKVGRTQEWAQAAKSHTWSITWNDEIFDVAFTKAWIVRVNNLDDFFNLAQWLDMQEIPVWNKLCIVTNAGGPGVISTDYLMKYGGALAQLSPDTMSKLDAILPHSWSHNNPIDILWDATDQRFRESLEICLHEKNADAILVILTPQDMTDATAIANELVKIDKKGKPIFAVWMWGEQVEEGRQILNKAKISSYATPEDAISCFLTMYKYSKHVADKYIPISYDFSPDKAKNKKLLDAVKKEKRYILTEAEAKEFVSNYGIPVAKSGIAKTADTAEKMADKIWFPVVMKILSPDILHKTDVGGVVLNINDKTSAKKAYIQIMKNVSGLKANIHGVFIEHMVNKKFELLIGCKKDPVFGQAIVFGMWGTSVEVFKDTSIALPPLDMVSAKRLIEGTKIATLLKWYRWMRWIDIESLQSILCKFSSLLADFPEISELDINPFSVDEEGGVVLDAKVIFDEKVLL